MQIDRRSLLIGAGAAAALPCAAAAGRARHAEIFAAAGKEAGGRYAAVVFDQQRGELVRTALPVRGHAVAVRPGTRTCVVFARSPGTVAVSLDARRRRATTWMSTDPDRHFLGHGAFSGDGRLLFASENDFEAGRGVIGVRDATDGYRRIGEFDSGGIGPHDLALLSDGRTLVVANGGLRTHPDYGGEPLNLASMTPSLAYVDVATGDLLERHTLAPELSRLSIRHLTIAAKDTVVFGCQHKGPRAERPALIGFHRRGETIRLLDLPRGVQGAMRNYVGSIRADRSGEIVAATSPRGGLAVFLDAAARRYLGDVRLDEVCGIAARRQGPGFLLTSGDGQLGHVTDGRRLEPLPAGKVCLMAAWDNHAAAL